MNTALRLANTVLLGAILWTVIDIYVGMPPTLGDFQSASNEKKKALALRRPYVHATVAEPVSVEIQK